MWDEVLYDNLAENVLEGKLYSDFLSIGGNVPPGYSVVISIAYLFSDNKSTIYHIMLIINSILTSSIIFPSYFILKNYCSKYISILGSLVIATLPSVTLYTFTLWSENLFITLFMFSLWFLLKSYETDKKIWEFLAASSVVLIYMTRSTGLAMLIGFIVSFIYYILVNSRSEKISNLIMKKRFFLTVFAFLLIIWIIYSTYLIPNISYNMGTPYNVNGLANQSINTMTNLDVFTKFLNFLLNNIYYLILTSYFMILLMIIYFVILLFNKNSRKSSLNISYIYFIISSLLLLFITSIFLFGYYKSTHISIYGRYIEPIIPLIFLFGFIALDKIQNIFSNNKYIIYFSLLYVFIVLNLIIFFPRLSHSFIDVFSTYYLQTIGESFLINLFIVIFSIVIFLFFYLSYKKYYFIYMLLILFIYCSIIFSVPVFSLESQVSSDYNEMVQYLNENSRDDTIILMNNTELNSGGRYIWSIATFWNKGDVILVSDVTNSSIVNSFNADFIISKKLLPYEKVANGRLEFTNRYKLYYIKPNNDCLVDFPYIIDIGSYDSDIIENFDHSNVYHRWTKNSSKVLIEFPSSSGDMNITISTVGYRPDDNPAKIEFYINDNKIGECIKLSGNFEYNFKVPSYYLNDRYQILRMETNTWRPCDYDYQDDTFPCYIIRDERQLGVKIDYIIIDNYVIN